jgi:hypothetical protein
MSRPPDHDQPAVPSPDESLIMPMGLGGPATRFGDESTIPIRPGQPIEPQPKHRPWWVLLLLLTLALAMLLGLSPFLYAAIRQSTMTSSVTGSTPTATATRTATARPTATRSPTATTVAEKFTVNPISTQQKCSAVLPLPSFSLTLSNLHTNSVGYHVSVVTPMPGTTTVWASVSPASGSIPAGARHRVDVTPNATLCTDSHFRGTKPFLLSVTAAPGVAGTFRVTDLVTSTL